MQFAMISYKKAIQMCNVCKTVLKKSFECELCEQKFEIKTTLICRIFGEGFEKGTKCILCDQ